MVWKTLSWSAKYAYMITFRFRRVLACNRILPWFGGKMEKKMAHSLFIRSQTKSPSSSPSLPHHRRPPPHVFLTSGIKQQRIQVNLISFSVISTIYFPGTYVMVLFICPKSITHADGIINRWIVSSLKKIQWIGFTV